jgi:hypothetical protein
LRRGRIASIQNYGFVPLRERDLLLRFETASDFFISRVLPKYRNLGQAKRELSIIAAEEANYNMDEFAPHSGEFIAKRAVVIKRNILAEPGKKGSRFPGSLATEILINLEPVTRVKYLERKRQENTKIFQDFREKIILAKTWSDSIIFMSNEESEKIPPDAWLRITQDPEILYGLWETSTTTVHVFMRGKSQTFRLLVNGMQSLPPEMHWQILAMKSILDKNERRFDDLFDDPEFISAYGKLLRMVYIGYIPLFYRILLMLGITLFQDSSFQIAKKKIIADQDALSRINKERIGMQKERKLQERKERFSKVDDLEKVNHIMEVLDGFYLIENYIPTLEEVRSRVTQMDSNAFSNTIEKHHFQIIPPAKGSTIDEILLYPMNHEWRTKAARLRRVVDKILLDSESGSEEKLRQSERAKRLLKILSRKEKAAVQETAAVEPVDPYERFGKEVKKFEENQKNLQEEEGDLEI